MFVNFILASVLYENVTFNGWHGRRMWVINYRVINNLEYQKVYHIKSNHIVYISSHSSIHPLHSRFFISWVDLTADVFPYTSFPVLHYNLWNIFLAPTFDQHHSPSPITDNEEKHKGLDYFLVCWYISVAVRSLVLRS